MNCEITTEGSLLDESGHLSKAGWAKDLLLKYSRASIKASKMRIKEWDYYCILKNNVGVAFTIADNGYMGFVSATVLDFDKKTDATKSIMTPFPMGKMKLPETSKQGDVKFSNNNVSMEFIKGNGYRTINVDFKDFASGKDLKGTIKLAQPKPQDTMVIATPFAEDKHAFYYNQKINCMPAEGTLEFGDQKLEFNPDSSFAVLDWGRGVWTYKNTWYWGSASGIVDNIPFGFNIGYGFGDTSKASENMVFYDNKASKLDQVSFNIPDDSFLKPWTFTSNDGRFEMDFVPIMDRYSNSDILVVKSVQHQVFGRFTGKVILDDNREIHIKDFLGFAEKVYNKW